MFSNGPITDAMKLPNGARFFRCALQVNPFAYVQRHSKKMAFTNEADYNASIVTALTNQGVEVIAITDHQRASTAEGLAQAAKKVGIIVFPGAELETKEGAHFLCLFDPTTSAAKVTGILGDCGIHDQNRPPATIKYDVNELLVKAKDFNCQFVAAHVASEKGILRVLDNQVRASTWKNPMLMACSLPGPISEAPDNLRPILENKNAHYHRDRPIAVLNVQDLSSPEDLAKSGATCWIKMSDVSIQGLRQAFLDPSSRIRLASDPAVLEEHSEFVALSWQGGFLDGASVHFNENLNVLIGGRGTGKSTIVESIRYVLGLNPIGEEAGVAHEGIVRNVLRSGTKISLLVCVRKPAPAYYLLERTIPNPSVVRDEAGEVLSLTPLDVLSRVEVYGQHEISELAKSPERRTRLLDRFIDDDPSLIKRKNDLKRSLDKSKARILEVIKEKSIIEERLNQLPAIEATLVRYQKLGLEEKLKEQNLLLKEDRVLRTAAERVAPLKDILEQLDRALPIDRAFLSSKALDDLPGKSILVGLDAVIESFSKQVETTALVIKAAIDKAESGIGTVRKQWDVRKQNVEKAYELILRELQKTKVDGAEFIRLRKQIEEMRPLKERLACLDRELIDRENERRSLVVEWEDAKAAEFRQLEKAAKKVTRKLDNRVLVEVVRAGNRAPLTDFLDDRIGGRLAQTRTAITQQPDLSIINFVETCRQGRDAILKEYAIPSLQAERLATLPREILLELEAIELPATTSIKLNVAPDSQPAQWQTLEELSTGQKATALLLLLLLESQSPLVVDQPEDDLDNRFITEGVVPKMREEKRRRQFIFTTHNANIPVLGDAELIVGLSASGDTDQGKAKIPEKYMSAIDSNDVRHFVEEVLEGGKEAFETRRLKYGF
ncbi:MAG: AAA family ATPase [Candidatus Aureabacteria bacterium]|nr:AAA family ATPase [Candidatus Auribacterota bacterium]